MDQRKPWWPTNNELWANEVRSACESERRLNQIIKLLESQRPD